MARHNIKDIKRGADIRFILLPNGRKLPMMGVPAIRYDAKLDIATGDIVTSDDPDHAVFPHPEINDLLASGKVSHGSYVREYEVNFSDEDSQRIFNAAADENRLGFDVDAVIREFRDHGFKVSRRAIMHNFRAWLGDYKSGFRCSTCHVFTPCGCNPLSFRATGLSPYCDWQDTYFC